MERRKMNITINDPWNYYQWRNRLAFQLSWWYGDGVRVTVAPERITMSASLPHMEQRVARLERLWEESQGGK
jgi:hypothetical protein